MADPLPNAAKPDGRLADNVVFFARALRKAGMRVGPASVKDAIEVRRMIRAELEVLAPVAYPVAVTISGLAADTETVRAAIRASLETMFAARARPGVAVSPATFSRSWIAEAISAALGEDRHVLTVPAADITLSDGSIPVLGTITYV